MMHLKRVLFRGYSKILGYALFRGLLITVSVYFNGGRCFFDNIGQEYLLAEGNSIPEGEYDRPCIFLHFKFVVNSPSAQGRFVRLLSIGRCKE